MSPLLVEAMPNAIAGTVFHRRWYRPRAMSALCCRACGRPRWRARATSGCHTVRTRSLRACSCVVAGLRASTAHHRDREDWEVGRATGIASALTNGWEANSARRWRDKVMRRHKWRLHDIRFVGAKELPTTCERAVTCVTNPGSWVWRISFAVGTKEVASGEEVHQDDRHDA